MSRSRQELPPPPTGRQMFGEPNRQNEAFSSRRARKTFVLCFDGTGNKFSGTDADSNILKIYYMLDRNDDNQLHYYQPGIGTYVTSGSLSHTSLRARLNSWYQKAKDSAIGTSFDEHVMGGYKFLMRYYMPGDKLYFFGFSRGAYVARFLAEMLDNVGLLSPGNEELMRFAWKTFSRWQQRSTDGKEEKENEEKMSHFMKAFRETFSRPVRRISFLGLFDTVNSVPRFEAAWMQRSKFPYTAKSSARVIRHAVGIDERRAKFRQDLMSESKPRAKQDHRHKHLNFELHRKRHSQHEQKASIAPTTIETNYNKNLAPQRQTPNRYRRPSRTPHPGTTRNRSPSGSQHRNLSNNTRSSVEVERQELSWKMGPNDTQTSIQSQRDDDSESEDEDEDEQDIQEVWFPGCHADIGGGWAQEVHSLSHGPLVWIVREAQRAGLHFDRDKMRTLRCYDDESPNLFSPRGRNGTIPQVRVSSPSASEVPSKEDEGKERKSHSPFHDALHTAATRGLIHDCLQFNNGLPHLSVISWNIMEYLPFRRMDLQPDGSWKPIRWPLPAGEVRDIPSEALIHNSALKRMQADKDYRPGNLIVGGGGRGVRRAPPEKGTGDWVVSNEEGDPVGEVWIRRDHWEKTRGNAEKA